MLVTYPFPQAATGARPGRLHQPADHRRPRPADDPDQPERRQGPRPADAAAGPDLAADRPADRLPTALPTAADRPADRQPAGAASRRPPAAARWRRRWRRPGLRPGRDLRQQHVEPLDAGRVRHQPGPPDDGGLRMIRRGVKVQLAAFLIITIVGVSYVSARYIGLGQPAARVRLRRHRRLRRVRRHLRERRGDLPRGGRRPGGPAPAGRRRRARRPADRPATSTYPRTPSPSSRTGRPSASSTSTCSRAPAEGPYLADGDRIDSDDNRTPLHTEELLLNLDRLVNSVDKRDLVVVIDELGKAFSGTGPDLQRLLDSGDALTRSAVDALPETLRLIEDGQTVLATQRESGSAIKSFSADLADLSDTLRTSDGDLRKVLDGGIVASQELQAADPRQPARPSRRCWPTCSPAARSPSPGWTAWSRCWSPTRTTSPAGTPWSRATAPRTSAWSSTPATRRSAPRATRAPRSGCPATPATGRPTPTRSAPRRAGSKTSVRGAQNAPAPSGAVGPGAAGLADRHERDVR